MRSRVLIRISLIGWLDHGKTRTRMCQDCNQPSDLVFPQLVEKLPCVSVWARSSACKTVSRKSSILHHYYPSNSCYCLKVFFSLAGILKTLKKACCSTLAQVLHLFHTFPYELRNLFLKQKLLQVGINSWQYCSYSCINGLSVGKCCVFVLTGKGSCQLAPTMDGLMIAMFKLPFSCWIRYSDKALV